MSSEIPQTAPEDTYEIGYQCLKDGEDEKALELLSQAVTFRVNKYGPLSLEAAPCYHQNGVALLYVYRKGSNALGGTKGDGQEGGEEESEGGKTGAAAKAVEAPAGGSEPAAGGEDDGEGDDDGEEEEGEEGEEEEGKGEGDGEGEEEGSGGGGPPATDLDLAWENLEVARRIFEEHRSGHLESLAKVHTRLAEVSMEREDWGTALGDYRTALSMLEELGGGRTGGTPRVRFLAEIHYCMALCHQYDDQPDLGIEEVRRAQELLEGRVAALQGGDAPDVADPAADVEALKGVLEDLKEVEADLRADFKSKEERRELVRHALGMLTSATAQPAGGGGSDGAGPSTGPAAFAFSSAPAADAAVKSLGVIGGSSGVKRVSLKPAAAPAQPAAAPQANAGKKRTLEDIMGSSADIQAPAAFTFDPSKLRKIEPQSAPAPAPSGDAPAFLRSFQVAAGTPAPAEANKPNPEHADAEKVEKENTAAS